MPYESTKRIDYTVVKKVPYIISSQVAVTEYEKEPYHVERTFEQTDWEKIPYEITIDEPYVVELWQHYTAQILIPFTVQEVEELELWEIEEYTISQEVPFVTSSPRTVVDIQKEVFTVPTVTKTTHSHDVLHDVNFGRDSIVSESVVTTAGEEGEY